MIAKGIMKPNQISSLGTTDKHLVDFFHFTLFLSDCFDVWVSKLSMTTTTKSSNSWNYILEARAKVSNHHFYTKNLHLNANVSLSSQPLNNHFGLKKNKLLAPVHLQHRNLWDNSIILFLYYITPFKLLYGTVWLCFATVYQLSFED